MPIIMKIFLVLIILLPLFLDGKDLDSFFEALIQVESGGKIDAVGDGGLAVGILQIQPIMLADANRIVGSEKYSLEDRLCPVKSRQIATVIFLHYAKSIQRNTGKNPTYEQLARIWNGGGGAWRPQSGQKEVNLDRYWSKISLAMQN